MRVNGDDTQKDYTMRKKEKSQNVIIMKTEQVHKFHHHMKRQSVEWVIVGLKAAGDGEDGSW